VSGDAILFLHHATSTIYSPGCIIGYRNYDKITDGFTVLYLSIIDIMYQPITTYGVQKWPVGGLVWYDAAHWRLNICFSFMVIMVIGMPW